MRYLIFILVLFFSTNLYADRYLVEKPDGSVVIAGYNEGSNDSLSEFLRSVGLAGLPVSRLSDSDIPQDRSERKYWKKNDVPIGGKIIIDTAAKQDDETKKIVKEERKRALLKLTPAEYQEAKDLGLVK